MEYDESPTNSPSRKDSNSSGFFEIPLSPDALESSQTPVYQEKERNAPEQLPPITTKPPPEQQPVSKKSSLKKKDSSNSVLDGVIHMGYLWHYNLNPDKKSSDHESALSKTHREEKYNRILRLDPRCSRNQWKRYYALIYEDGRFAWYKPTKANLYNKRTTAELEEVLFIPWRVCAFGTDVVHKLCSVQLEAEDVIIGKSASAPSSPRMASSPPGTLTSLLESATRGLCICSSPSVVSLIVPPSPTHRQSTATEHEELTCIVPKTSKESLLLAVGGHDWEHGEIYCFACEDQEDLELWRESFVLLSHRKIIQRSAFDHLLNTPVIIGLPGSV